MKLPAADMIIIALIMLVLAALVIFAPPVFAQAQTAVWIQYDLITGAETGTNSRQVSDTDLAALGKGQIEYTGAGDATRMRVDLTQTPPAIVPDSPSQ